jgi:hypothetical protein
MDENKYPFMDCDIFLQKTPFSFDASVWEFFMPLLVGGTLIMAPNMAHTSPKLMINLINEKKVSVFTNCTYNAKRTSCNPRVSYMRPLSSTYFVVVKHYYLQISVIFLKAILCIHPCIIYMVRPKTLLIT